MKNNFTRFGKCWIKKNKFWKKTKNNNSYIALICPKTDYHLSDKIFLNQFNWDWVNLSLLSTKICPPSLQVPLFLLYHCYETATCFGSSTLFCFLFTLPYFPLKKKTENLKINSSTSIFRSPELFGAISWRPPRQMFSLPATTLSPSRVLSQRSAVSRRFSIPPARKFSKKTIILH